MPSKVRQNIRRKKLLAHPLKIVKRDFNQNDFGPDANQTATFSFLRQSFIDASMVLEIGDLIDWNYGYFEVGSINENQLIGGMFDQNFSVIASAFLIRKSSVQIERVRSI